LTVNVLAVNTTIRNPAVRGHAERAQIRYAMGQAGRNLEAAAKLLGLSRKGLYLKRKRLGLE
jgi:DNA-binding NtrC family response regulator